MKIAHLSHSDGEGGAAKAAYRIHRGLLELGHDSQLHVASKINKDPTVYGPESIAAKIWAKTARKVDSLPTKLLRSKNPSLVSPAWFGSGVLDFSKINQADVIQLHWICGGLMRLESLARLRNPLLWRLPDMWAFSGGEHFTYGSTRPQQGYTKQNRPDSECGFDLNRWVWQRKKALYAQLPYLHLVAPSRWMARCIRESELLKDRPVEVIHTGQDTRLFSPVTLQQKQRLRKELGWPLDKQIILFGAMNATTDSRKGFSYVAEAARVLAVSNENLALVVFGVDDPTESLPLGGLENYLLPRTEDVKRLYQAADIFLAPSVEENLANTAVEAMACATPVVGFEVGGMPDLVIHQSNGFLAKDLNSVALAEGIRWLLKDPMRLEAIAQNARATIEQSFSQEAQAKRFAELYQRVLSR